MFILAKGTFKVVVAAEDGSKTYEELRILSATKDITDFDSGVKKVISTSGISGGVPLRKTRDTFLTVNAVLADGQLAIELDTGKIKMGDGTTVYSLLPYIAYGNSFADAYAIFSTSDNLAKLNPVVPENTYIFESDTSRIRHCKSGYVAYNNVSSMRYKKYSASETIIIPKLIADYSSLLVQYDFIPNDNQVVVELDTRKFKIGDGTTLYSELEYNTSSCESVENISSDVSIPVLDNYNELINLSDSPVSNKLIISIGTEIKTKIGDGKTDYFNLGDSTPLFIDDEGNEYELYSLDDDQNSVLPSTSAVDVDNPVLADGELYTELSFTYSLKIGNGTTGFNELTYDENNISRIPPTIFIFDTSNNFSTANPVLAKGLVGVETDTNKIKIGNGITEWNDTMYQKTIGI